MRANSVFFLLWNSFSMTLQASYKNWWCCFKVMQSFSIVSGQRLGVSDLRSVEVKHRFKDFNSGRVTWERYDVCDGEKEEREKQQSLQMDTD